MTTKKNAASEAQIVFMGDSITEMWAQHSPEFFSDCRLVNRGISGQVTGQMLQRFRQDVIDLQPEAVIILAGINDIAQNAGFIAIEDIAANIHTMTDLADYHGIKVVLCSVLPAFDFPWNPGLEPSDKVVELNQMLIEIANTKSYTYVDYYAAMVDDRGGLRVPELTTADDLVHPNHAGYDIMETVLRKTLRRDFPQL